MKKWKKCFTHPFLRTLRKFFYLILIKKLEEVPHSSLPEDTKEENIPHPDEEIPHASFSMDIGDIESNQKNEELEKLKA